MGKENTRSNLVLTLGFRMVKLHVKQGFPTYDIYLYVSATPHGVSPIGSCAEQLQSSHYHRQRRVDYRLFGFTRGEDRALASEGS